MVWKCLGHGWFSFQRSFGWSYRWVRFGRCVRKVYHVWLWLTWPSKATVTLNHSPTGKAINNCMTYPWWPRSLDDSRGHAILIIFVLSLLMTYTPRNNHGNGWRHGYAWPLFFDHARSHVAQAAGIQKRAFLTWLARHGFEEHFEDCFWAATI